MRPGTVVAGLAHIVARESTSVAGWEVCRVVPRALSGDGGYAADGRAGGSSNCRERLGSPLCSEMAEPAEGRSGRVRPASRGARCAPLPKALLPDVAHQRDALGVRNSRSRSADLHVNHVAALRFESG